MEAGLPCHHGKGHGSGAASAAALQVLPAQQLTLPLQLMVPLHCTGTAACLYAQVRPEKLFSTGPVPHGAAVIPDAWQCSCHKDCPFTAPLSVP